MILQLKDPRFQLSDKWLKNADSSFFLRCSELLRRILRSLSWGISKVRSANVGRTGRRTDRNLHLDGRPGKPVGKIEQQNNNTPSSLEIYLTIFKPEKIIIGNSFCLISYLKKTAKKGLNNWGFQILIKYFFLFFIKKIYQKSNTITVNTNKIKIKSLNYYCSV